MRKTQHKLRIERIQRATLPSGHILAPRGIKDLAALIMLTMTRILSIIIIISDNSNNDSGNAHHNDIIITVKNRSVLLIYTIATIYINKNTNHLERSTI